VFEKRQQEGWLIEHPFLPLPSETIKSEAGALIQLVWESYNCAM